MLGNPKAKPVKSSSKILKAALAVFISATLVLGIVVLLGEYPEHSREASLCTLLCYLFILFLN